MTKKIFNSPLSVCTGRKNFILNLNQYRNAHYRVTNNAKRKYKEFMEEQINSYTRSKGKCMFVYTIYKGDNRIFDIGNICSIHQKFFEDALVELGKLGDDKFSVVPMVVYCFGGIDKKNPRVEIELVDDAKGFKSRASRKLERILERLY